MSKRREGGERSEERALSDGGVEFDRRESQSYVPPPPPMAPPSPGTTGGGGGGGGGGHGGGLAEQLSKTNLYIRGLLPATTDQDLIKLCQP
ncbi:RNA-binding motif, single-stranded-interacting protein 3 [Takifugu flavidus]|uniref:RNA-binding motif, single-stranded-interacting protein 3 n=1 Tax=Takifugu flavidus TaxID=433684 RepID=A0A5C6PJC8_9TELE|nr:RNA-binding motif, single-stranded-interacting protein 3 [Takifugu flavidus]